MTGSHAQGPGSSPEQRVSSRRLWRTGTPVVLLLSGALFVVSGVNSHGTDLRPGRYTNLATLVRNDRDDVRALQDRAAALTAEVTELRSGVGGKRAERVQRRADRLRGAAGLDAVTGPGVSVLMSDAPESTLDAALNDPAADLDRYVVHQQDIQAVVNALWAGGAEAVTIQGQRVVTTTGIKCEGNAVQLQGVPYPQPYRIEAVGDPATLRAALDTDIDVTAFRDDAANSSIGVGWSLDDADVDAPGYTGLLDITSAEPASSGS